jgi:pSer/pThr/pTyr-binding forkhead associated (FHA) protein
MSGIVLLILRLGMIVALYAFLGWGLWQLWRDLRYHGQTVTTTRLPALKLVQEIEAQPLTQRFTSPQVVVGRDPGCHCRLDDRVVSARHARLSYHHGQWWVEDLHSRNGTFLNDSPVKGPVVVTSGDELHFGTLAFHVVLEE